MARRWGDVITLGAALVLLVVGPPASAHPSTTVSNQLTAQNDADALLGLVTLPSGATSLSSEPAGDGGLLAAPFQKPATSALVDRSSLWRVPASEESTFAFIQAHPPTGSRRTGDGVENRPGAPADHWVTFSLPSIPGTLSTRQLAIWAVALPDGSTGVRVDAQVVWVLTRASSEKVPAGVRRLDITSVVRDRPPIVSVRLTNHGEIKRIIHWIDGLGVVQPGAYSCPGQFGDAPTVTFDFRGPRGRSLARARVLDYAGGTSGPCNPIAFSVRGQRRTPLIGGDFLRRVQRLLHVRFIPVSCGSNTRRSCARAAPRSPRSIRAGTG